MLHYLTIFSTFIATLLAANKCDSNAFCYSPDANSSITISCDKVENSVTLKLKTLQLSPIIHLLHGKNTFDFKCRYPLNQKYLVFDPKTFKLEISEGVTSCQISSYENFIFSQSHDTYLQWYNKTSDRFTIHGICNPKVEGLTKEVKRVLVKIHAILMLLGWLFFVPTGFLFARFGRDLFQEKKLVGMPIWFQIHRSSTFIGVSCVCISILCILLSTNFSWKGTGSSAWYWTQWHTDLGTISSILAVSQPLNSLIRCSPSNSQRSIFNWAHRIVGIASYTFAVAAIYVAAANYRKTWSEPVMEIVLTTVPTVLIMGTALVLPYLNKRKSYVQLEMNEKNERKEKSAMTNQPVYRISWIFLTIGICLGCAASLSLLVANGFKSG